MNKYINILIFLINYYVLISIIINQSLNFNKEYKYLYHLYIKYIYS